MRFDSCNSVQRVRVGGKSVKHYLRTPADVPDHRTRAHNHLLGTIIWFFARCCRLCRVRCSMPINRGAQDAWACAHPFSSPIQDFIKCGVSLSRAWRCSAQVWVSLRRDFFWNFAFWIGASVMVCDSARASPVAYAPAIARGTFEKYKMNIWKMQRVILSPSNPDPAKSFDKITSTATSYFNFVDNWTWNMYFDGLTLPTCKCINMWGYFVDKSSKCFLN